MKVVVVLVLVVAAIGCTHRVRLPPHAPPRPTEINRVNGFVQGAAVGLLAGVGVGAAVTANADSCDSARDDFCLIDEQDLRPLALLTYGAIGFGLGGSFGAMRGSRTVYEPTTVIYAPRLTPAIAPGTTGVRIDWRF